MIVILDAVMERLRAVCTDPALTLTNSSIEVEGSPPPRAGDVYVTVAERGVSTNGVAAQAELNEVHSIEVFLNFRIAANPLDRYDKILRRNAKNIRSLERQVLSAIHGKQAVRVAANAGLLALSISGDYLTPLYYSGRGRTEIRGPDWSSETNGGGWLVRSLPFEGMRRILYLDSIT